MTNEVSTRVGCFDRRSNWVPPRLVPMTSSDLYIRHVHLSDMFDIFVEETIEPLMNRLEREVRYVAGP